MSPVRFARVVPGRRARRWHAWPAVAVAAVAAGSLLAACGGPSVPGVASLPSGTKSGSAEATGYAHTPLGFALCMRAHGAPNFPEPNASGGQFVIDKQSFNPQDPRIQRAFDACKSLIGFNFSPAQQAAAETQALKFARCMRAHGVPDFPDPIGLGQGGFGFKVHSGRVLEQNNPTFVSAARACSSVKGGIFGQHKR
jgi:hypothetical protein